MKDPNVIVVHGAYGYPEENWFGWLKNRLNQQGIASYVPHLPTPQEQSLSHWLRLFNHSYSHLVHEQTILIGHSLGAAFILRWMAQSARKIAVAILVGAFIGKVGLNEFDEINQRFFNDAFDWQGIKKCSHSFISYYGDNDPYVTKKQFHWIAEQLGARKIIVSQAGHFNTVSGYSKFPLLLSHLKQILKGNPLW